MNTTPKDVETPEIVAPDGAVLGVMRLLAESPKLSQRELASHAGISLGKVNYCLRALIARGFVKAQNYRKSSNKRAYLYLLTPAGISRKAELTRLFLARKVTEYEALGWEIEGLRREFESLAERSPGAGNPKEGA